MVACEGLISVTRQSALYHQLIVLYPAYITNSLSYTRPISPVHLHCRFCNIQWDKFLKTCKFLGRCTTQGLRICPICRSWFQVSRPQGSGLWKSGVDAAYLMTFQLSASAITLDNSLQYRSNLITFQFLQPTPQASDKNGDSPQIV